MSDVIRIISAGFATVQDLGRVGHEGDGVSRGGASDQVSAILANLLVGNADNAPLLEVTASSLVFSPSCPLLMAVTGAAAVVTVDGYPRPQYQPLFVEAGQTVSLVMTGRGIRTYVALAGQLAADSWLGSCAPYPIAGIDNRLTPGGCLIFQSRVRHVRHPYFDLPLFQFPTPRCVPRLTQPAVIDVTPGPHATMFAELGATLYGSEYTVGHASNHVGLRLTGPCPSAQASHPLPSRGVPVGAVEIPPGKDEILVLLRGRLVTAGYPVVAVATQAAQSHLGQLGPGDRVRFRCVPLHEAVQRARTQRQAIRTLATQVATAFASHDIPVVPTRFHT